MACGHGTGPGRLQTSYAQESFGLIQSSNKLFFLSFLGTRGQKSSRCHPRAVRYLGGRRIAKIEHERANDGGPWRKLEIGRHPGDVHRRDLSEIAGNKGSAGGGSTSELLKVQLAQVKLSQVDKRSPKRHAGPDLHGFHCISQGCSSSCDSI